MMRAARQNDGAIASCSRRSADRRIEKFTGSSARNSKARGVVRTPTDQVITSQRVTKTRIIND